MRALSLLKANFASGKYAMKYISPMGRCGGFFASTLADLLRVRIAR